MNQINEFLDQFQYQNIYNESKSIVKDGKAGIRPKDEIYDQAYLFLWKHKMGTNYQRPR